MRMMDGMLGLWMAMVHPGWNVLIPKSGNKNKPIWMGERRKNELQSAIIQTVRNHYWLSIVYNHV
jgi:hypothetical protein